MTFSVAFAIGLFRDGFLLVGDEAADEEDELWEVGDLAGEVDFFTADTGMGRIIAIGLTAADDWEPLSMDNR